jgi:triacylglycerol lipase
MSDVPATQPGVNDGDVRTSSGHALDLKALRFSLANARELALYARMAYDEPPTIQDAATDTQVLIRELGDCVVVAFRGTSDLRDFVTDAEAWRISSGWGGVHCGFGQACAAIANRIYVALMPSGPKPVILTGHSLGGALAILAAIQLRTWMVNVHSVYTFGAPRVGDPEFQKSYDTLPVPGSPFTNLGAATFTLIHDCDLVPRVPGWLAGYRRPGHDEFMSTAGDIWEDPNVVLRLFSDVVSMGKAWTVKCGWLAATKVLADHHIDKYISALASAQEVPR